MISLSLARPVFNNSLGSTYISILTLVKTNINGEMVMNLLVGLSICVGVRSC